MRGKMAGGENAFRQLEDVGCPSDIFAMKWNPKMDLIAIITAEGAVWLNRLSWQRVWTLSSSEYQAISLAWRPDGKVLALGLDNGRVHLVNVENSECLHEYNVGSNPLFLDWITTNTPHTSTSNPEEGNLFTEKGDSFLPPLPHLPSGGSTVLAEGKTHDGPWDPKRLKELAGTLSFLVVADENAVVTLLAHGLLPIGQINARGHIGPTMNCRILSASIDAQIHFLMIVVETSPSSDFNNSVVSIITFDTKLFSSRSEELEVLSLKYGQISSLLTYLDKTFAAMSEAWEDVLLEVDSKLEKYASSLGPDMSVSEEFLTLFTCGVASPELQMFLVNDLTEKGLKKLGKTVESSYSNIQSLALKNLQPGSNALFYHLSDLMGMAKWFERFGILGLSDSLVAASMKILGSLMLKTQELLGIIESALQSFIEFFKWLYLVILQLLDEEVPAFVKQSNQEDVSLITEFLNYQLGQKEKGKTRLSMERVGQYLKKEPLVFKVDNSENIWVKFLATCPELANSPYIFTVDPEKSLVSLYDELASSINTTFEKLINTTEQSLLCNLRIPLSTCTVGKQEVSHISSVSGIHHWITMVESKPTPEKLHLVRLTSEENTPGVPVAEGVTVGFQGMVMNDEEQSKISVVDLGFYDDTTITLLLHQEDAKENSSDFLTQFKFASLGTSQLKRLTSSEDVNCDILASHLVDASSAVVQRRNLERMKAVKVAVSGSRKVACVLSTSRTRVKLFDMNADEEEEGDETIDEHQSSTMFSDSTG